MSEREDDAKIEIAKVSAKIKSPDYDACSYFLIFLGWVFSIIIFPIFLFGGIKVISEYERAVILRLGRIREGKAVGPGLFVINAFCDEVKIVDIRTVSFDIPPQEILTKDNVTVSVDAVVYYNVASPVASVVNVENASLSTRLLAQTTLRNILGTRSLTQLLTEREEIAKEMQAILDGATDPWGINVDRVEVKNVILPQSLQRAMAAEAEASREAKAKIIAAQGEMDASKNLREAARIISESPSALQLRYLQTLNSIAAEKNSTIIFPLPLELLPQQKAIEQS
ncbi:unnamed protein product [Oikopleura dioica]|uniref:Band 7 domain-containing protein n=1 Tax=Oikopleura dioica TaxID=34765 RepID=E4XM83_OIKDI|nr:unnamed protein product [Oikopleura dioica]